MVFVFLPVATLLITGFSLWGVLEQNFRSSHFYMGRMTVIAKYDQLIADFADHADHMELLKTQREGIQAAFTEIEANK